MIPDPVEVIAATLCARTGYPTHQWPNCAKASLYRRTARDIVTALKNAGIPVATEPEESK